MQFSEWPIRGSEQEIIGINFQMQLKVKVYLTFKVDLDQEVIQMITTNYAEFKNDRMPLKPHRLNEEWLDRLGKYILRKEENLHALQMDDSAKESIRKMLEEERLGRQKELEEAIKREEAEREEEKKNSLMGKLKNLVKKPQQ
jgi:hypothetical protein